MNAIHHEHLTLRAAMVEFLAVVPARAYYHSVLPPHARGPFRVWVDTEHAVIEQRTHSGHWQLVAEWECVS